MRVLLWLCGLPFRLIRRFATFFAVCALILSLGFNVAMLTVSGVFAAAGAALSGVGVATVASREAGAKLATRKIGRDTAEKVTRRVQRSAVRNIASVGGEAIPIAGVAVIAGALAMEVKDACDTAADMAGLEAALAADGDADTARADAVNAFDCRDILPGYDDLPGADGILAMVSASPKAAWEASAAYYDTLDLAAGYASARDGISSWFGGMTSYADWQAWWDGEPAPEVARP